ncbi:hypothetical protein [Fluviicola sp.]|uniref:hypothetical protein n=1 Tax=Fluviicola sp. TaxID=1917219 RepID=UPI00282531A0|nr:hypothetical protein [Fluviicola sp.]MDR0801718.1 hypothetical protein [Fluviicola sp.]
MKTAVVFSAVLMMAIAIGSCKKKPVDPNSDGSSYASMEVYKKDAMGVIYNQATNSVAYNKPDADGTYKIYISGFDGTGEIQLTYPGWASNRHQWAEEWDPTGQYLYCYVEKTDYVPESGHTRTPQDAIPGYGAYTDLWIIKRDGSQAWQMTNFPNDYNHGIIHGAISHDGTLFAWTERIQAPVLFDLNLAAGAYVFKVADVSWSPQPAFSNIRTYQPNGEVAGGEVESISPDKTDILVYSTFESHNLVATPIYRISLASGSTSKLTDESFSQAPTYTPGGQQIVYMTGKDCDIFPGQLQGSDWWIMNADGSNKKRLTYMNRKNHPQSINSYRLAGSLSFINDSTFIGGIMTQSLGLVGYSALVKF